MRVITVGGHASIYRIKFEENKKGCFFMAEKNKTNLYLLGIVGIVAVVWIVALILNYGASKATDTTGQALGIGLKKCVKSIVPMTLLVFIVALNVVHFSGVREQRKEVVLSEKMLCGPSVVKMMKMVTVMDMTMPLSFSSSNSSF